MQLRCAHQGALNPLWLNQVPTTHVLIGVGAISAQDIGAIQSLLGFEGVMTGKGLSVNEQA